jgi:surface polysaccharide O-acyltransferase-like enzyme
MLDKSSGLNPSSTADSNKIFYINNLKIFLTIIVVIHHAVITYGAAGSWYYTQRTVLIPAIIVMNLFIHTNMTFFMGFFFFLSSYFIEPSLNKKGPKKFLMERFKRLGIPLVFYSIFLSPTLNYVAEHYGKGEHNSFIEYMSGYRHWIDFGVLWFVAALLIFTLLFTLSNSKQRKASYTQFYFPGNFRIFLFALAIGFISYLVRGYFPIGWTLFPLGFQLAYFPQYIILFIAGIIAYRNNWLEKITYKKGTLWMNMALISIVIIFPLMYTIRTLTHSNDDLMRGYFTWQSLVFAEWENITGISLIIGLLGIAREKWNSQSSIKSLLTKSSYGVYIFHPLVLICLSLAVQGVQVEPLIKFIFVAPLTVICSALLTQLLLKVPVFANII